MLQVEHLADLFGLHAHGELQELVAQPVDLAQDLRRLDPMPFLLHGHAVAMAGHEQSKAVRDGLHDVRAVEAQRRQRLLGEVGQEVKGTLGEYLPQDLTSQIYVIFYL